jgi:hypothetical protein
MFTFSLPIIVAWLAFVPSKLPFSNSNDELKEMIHRATGAAPVIAVVAFSAGVIQGQSALGSFEEPYRLELKGTRQTESNIASNV